MIPNVIAKGGMVPTNVSSWLKLSLKNVCWSCVKLSFEERKKAPYGGDEEFVTFCCASHKGSVEPCRWGAYVVTRSVNRHSS
jgi:hypothetical protein